MTRLLAVDRSRVRRSLVAAAVSGLLASVGGSTVADVRQRTPLADLHAGKLIAEETLPLIAVPAVDRAQALEDDDERELAGLPPHFAVPNRVSTTPDKDGIWEMVDGDLLIWRVTIAAPRATSLNLGFTRFRMPDGGRMQIYSTDREYVIRPFTAKDNQAHGQLWTPIVPSDEIVVEIGIPKERRRQLLIEIGYINVGYREIGGGNQRSGACNVDVVCPDGDDWRDEIPSVGVYTLNGIGTCSGVMVNNTAEDATPLFLTAFHCGVNADNDQSMVVYWNYETSTCGGTPDGVLNQFTAGATSRVNYSPSDISLVELNSSPPSEWGITFSGWDRSGNEASTAVAIHHPSLDEKRISFEFQPTTTTSYFGTAVPGNGTHHRVADWDLGTTEGGSSGSPLYNENHHIIGQLHGGTASCSSQTSDWYGKFAYSWNNSSISSYLDPLGLNPTSLDTRKLNRPRLEFLSYTLDDSQGNNDGIADPGDTLVVAIDTSNVGDTIATGVQGTLSTATPLVTVVDTGATYPDVPPSGTASSDAPHFTVELSEDFPCGDTISFEIRFSSNEGNWTRTFVMPTGTNTGPHPGFSDDMESGTNGWTVVNLVGANSWIQTGAEWHSPTTSWFVADIGSISDSTLVSPVVSHPLELRFWMNIDSEGGFDGGVLEYTTDAGSSWLDAGNLITQVPYNTTISTEFGSPIGGRPAWSGMSNGWIQVIVDTAALAGRDVQFRWRFATDSSVGAVGMYLDDVEFDETTVQCSAPLTVPGEASEPNTASSPFRLAFLAPSPPGRGTAGSFQLRWGAPLSGGATADYVLYRIPMDNWGVSPTCEAQLGSATSIILGALTDNAGFLVVARNAAGEGSYGTNRFGERRRATVGICP